MRVSLLLTWLMERKRRESARSSYTKTPSEASAVVRAPTPPQTSSPPPLPGSPGQPPHQLQAHTRKTCPTLQGTKHHLHRRSRREVSTHPYPRNTAQPRYPLLEFWTGPVHEGNNQRDIDTPRLSCDVIPAYHGSFSLHGESRRAQYASAQGTRPLLPRPWFPPPG